MEVVDCGVGVLSMHAPYEVAAKLDTYMAYKGYKAFYQSK
jgi:aspartyl aminopeptidase